MRSRSVLALTVATTLGLCAGTARATQPMTSETSLLRVAFVSPTRGVGLFETARGPTSGNGPERCTLYTRPTGNGGVSFGKSRATLARTNCENGAAISMVTFDRPGDLFAYGSRLEVSRNLGTSWTSPHLPGSVAGLAVSGNSVLVLVTHCRPGEATCRLTLYESAGGGTWRPLSAQPPDHVVVGSVAAESELGGSTLLSVAPDGTVVLALPGLPPPPTARFPSMATVESLRPDAGRWTETQVPCASGGSDAELSIAPDGSRWLACASEPSTGVQPKSLAVSDGPAERWRVVARMCGLGTGCRERMPLGGYLGGLAALSATTAFYIGDRDSLVGTFDGGMKWRTWQRIGGQDAGTLQVTFFGSHDGWAVARQPGEHSSLWRTHDGGRTWTDP